MGEETVEIRGEILETPEYFTKIKVPYEAALKQDVGSMKEFYKTKPGKTLSDILTISRDTHFHIAAYKGNEKMLQTLFEMLPQEIDVREVLTQKDIHGNTPLHEVATTDNVKAAELLVGRLLARKDGKISVQEKDIRERENLLKLRNNFGETALFRAAANGRKKMLQYLVKEVEHVGDIREHYYRNDQISILHIAIIGQHFDTALWLLKRERTLGLLKEKSGMTCLQLLASMPKAFKSSSQIKGLKLFVYICLPSNLRESNDDDYDDDDDEFDQPLSQKGEDIERGIRSNSFKKSVQRSIPYRVIYRMYCDLWRFLGYVWEKISETQEMKQKHELAQKLARKLVKIDHSWALTHETLDNTIYIEEYGRVEESTSVTIASAKKKKKSSLLDTPLLIAASNGIEEIVTEILLRYPQAIDHVSRNGQNILHVAIMYRQLGVFEHLENLGTEVGKLTTIIDNSGYSILHHAADTSYFSGGTRPGAAWQLQEELRWFERVRQLIPSHYVMHQNNEGLTAEELFKEMHKDQHQEAKKWISNIAQSCSAVAQLVASVVFAVAFGVPGGFRGESKIDSEKNDTSTKRLLSKEVANREGLPILLDKPLYSFFTVMDVTSLATSQISLVLFLSILTSSNEHKDFRSNLPWKLTLAFNFLFFSVTTAMATFIANIFLTVRPKHELVKILNYVAAFFPIILFIIAQSPMYAAFSATFMDVLKLIWRIILPQKCLNLCKRSM